MHPEVSILAIIQNGRLAYETALLVASLRSAMPDFSGRIVLAEPQPGPLWESDPRVADPDLLDLYDRLNAEVVPLENRVFGSRYPQGNKIEALSLLPAGQPFLFLDSDTVCFAPVDHLVGSITAPTASSQVTGTWPRAPIYGPGLFEIWTSLYRRFGVEMPVNHSFPADHWRHYLYLNAGWIAGPDPSRLGDAFTAIAASIWDNPPQALAAQKLAPWLDQIALPIALAKLGGGWPDATFAPLDSGALCHYRHLSLLYTRGTEAQIDQLEALASPNWLKRVLKRHEPYHRLIYRGTGRALRARLTQAELPPGEQPIRKWLKLNGGWWPKR